MTEVAWLSAALAAGGLVYGGFLLTFKLRHWWEDEMDRWRDFKRELRQMLETFIPLLYALGTVAVIGCGYWISRQ